MHADVCVPCKYVPMCVHSSIEAWGNHYLQNRNVEHGFQKQEVVFRASCVFDPLLTADVVILAADINAPNVHSLLGTLFDPERIRIQQLC